MTRRPSEQRIFLGGAVLGVCVLLGAATPTVGAPAAGAGIGVATESARATEAAVAQLRAGGNAADAAVSATLVGGVASPSSSGLGGGCFIHLWDAANASSQILDARESAPAGIHTGDFEHRPFPPNARGRYVGVPGELAGLYELHRRFGRRTWSDVVLPAAQVAQRGISVHPHLHRMLARMGASISVDTGLAELWLPRGNPRALGAWVKHPRLGATLERVAREGPLAFYAGAVAGDLVRAVRALGGSLSLDDLALYQPVERAPLRVEWEGFQIYTMPAPSAGGLLLAETLNLHSKAELQALGRDTPAYRHALAETFRGALSDRIRYLGDPAFEPVALEDLAAPARLRTRRARMGPGTHSVPDFALSDHGTQHLVVADRAGNVVALTTTINNPFGARVLAPASGILLNDELDDFAIQSQATAFGLSTSPNRVRPGARPVSSMTPTVVVRDGRAVLALGGSGGMNIATDVAQALLARLVFGLSPQAIVAGPRFQIPTQTATILLPPNTPPDQRLDLQRYGEVLGEGPLGLTAVQMVAMDERGVLAAADPQKHGVAFSSSSPR